MQQRREFIGALGAGLVGASVAKPAPATDKPKGNRKRMAIVTTEWRYLSHAQHMGDRFLVGYPLEGEWRKPQLDVVSIYVDQKPKGDLSAQRAEEFRATVYPTIAETLRCGGDKLAVDAVLTIGEHGDYPRNELGQKLYPRYRFFENVVSVFKEDDKTVPVFNDKHLSWKWEWAKKMVETSRSMGFPLMAGSSLPVTWRMPSVEIPLGADVEEVMGLALGGIDSYDFHSLETIQCMAERRKGGETGVAWVQALRGEAVWDAMKLGSWDAGGFSPDLFEACLCRSQTLAQPRESFNDRHPTPEEIRKLVKDPVVYRFQYKDGLKGTMLLMNGLVGDFTFSAKLKNEPKPISTLFYLPPTPNVTYSAILMSQVEKMFLTGKAQYSVERTLLTSGVLAAAMKSMATGQKRIATPHLSVSYQPTRESTYGEQTS